MPRQIDRQIDRQTDRHEQTARKVTIGQNKVELTSQIEPNVGNLIFQYFCKGIEEIPCEF